MTKPIIRIHNLETNEIIDREMTDDEFADYEANQIAESKRQVELAERAAARLAILEKLGLTEEEAAVLLG